MKPKAMLLVLFALFFSVFNAFPVQADGIIVPIPPCPLDIPCPPAPQPLPMRQLAIRYHHVTVKIDYQLAITHVDQVFFNPSDVPIEGAYLFPLPKDAVVSNFMLWVDGQAVEGKLLSADEARKVYESTVNQMRDPALLEYTGRGAVQARIYPIPPQGERRIELEYTQVLTADNGLVGYQYPLNTEKFSTLPLEDLSISVTVHSAQPIRAVYSPSHAVAVSRPDEFTATASYAASQVRPDMDFFLDYSIGESQAFHLLSFRDPNDPQDPDGFFLALLAPKPDVTQAVSPKDLILVLDRSGSMQGEKFRQAQAALDYILNHLNPQDRFNLISFSSSVQTFADGLQPAAAAAKGVGWVDRLNAEGSTDINRALLEAGSMADKERPTYLIFLTDGLPTTGETNRQKILDNFAEAAPSSLRLFAFGVGYDVDTNLLDALTQTHHGVVTYVRPGDPLDEILSSFYARISTPLLTDLAIDFGGLATYDVYPQPLPDLFLGAQIVVVGRYRQGGAVDVTLSGNASGVPQTLRYPEQVFATFNAGASGALDSLPRLWATRKIGYLLTQIKLKGPDKETVDQIVHLSIRYGIITPYTSFLVTEPSAVGEDAQQRIANKALDQLQAAPAAPASGQGAVQKSADLGSMAGAQAPQSAPTGSEDKVRVAGSHTFVLTDGVWTDTTYDPKMTTLKVAFLSSDYFALAGSGPELAAAMALGSRLIAVAGGKAYEVVVQGASLPPVAIPATLTPGPISTQAAGLGQPTPTFTHSQPTSTRANTSEPGGKSSNSLVLPTCLGGLILPLGLSLFFALRKRG
jgi:Ca-activated chloride channel family protein